MRTIWLFPLGILVGVAIGWGLWRAATPGTDAAPPAQERSAAGGEGAEDGGGSVPERPDFPEPDDPVPEEVRRGEVPEEHAARFHLSLAAAAAIVGRLDGFLADVDRAIAAGATAGQAQPLVALLPKKLRPEGLGLVARHPDLGWDLTGLSDLYRDAGNRVKAFDLLVAEIERKGGPPGELAGRLVALDPARAADVLDELARRLSWGPNVLMGIATQLAGTEQAHRAVSFLLSLLVAEPTRGDAIDLLGRIDPARGVEAARNAVRTDPKNAGALARMAGLLLESGDREGAFAAYAKAVDAGEDSDQRRAWMRALLQMDAERALPAIVRAARGGDDETLGVLGRAYLITGRKSEAFDTFLDAHRKDQNDAEWLHHLAALDPGRASDLFVGEIEASGGSAGDELIGAYARTLLDLGQREKAYGMFLAALEKDEEDWEWMRGLAQADPGRALPLLEARSRREPDDPDTAGALGDAYAALGRSVDAVRQFETAIKASDDPGRWLAALVGVDEGRGMAMLRAALEESPGDDELWGALGDAHRGQGRHGEAREAYEKALELDPSDWEWNLKRDQLR